MNKGPSSSKRGKRGKNKAQKKHSSASVFDLDGCYLGVIDSSIIMGSLKNNQQASCI